MDTTPDSKPEYTEKDAEYTRVADNLFIRESTGRYYLIIRINGNQIRRSLKTKIRSIANTKLREELIKLGSFKTLTSKDSIPTFAAAYPLSMQAFQAEHLRPRSLETIESHLSLAAASFIGAMRVCNIKSPDLLKYLRSRSIDASGHTANLDLQALNRFFKFALENNWCASNPTESITSFEHKAKKRHIPTRDDIARVLKWLRASDSMVEDRKRAADYIEFLALSGLRVEGSQTLTWENVNFEKGCFSVTEKGDKTRTVNLFPQLRDFLLRIKKDVGPVFGEYLPRTALATAFKETGVEYFTFHALRHYFATECLEQGITPAVIAGWLGHSDAGTLVMRVYGNHIRVRHFEQEAAKVRIDLGGTSSNTGSE